MPDINQLWGQDIQPGPTGDLGVVDGLQLSIQRIVRRLMTRGATLAAVNQPATVGEMIFHPEYGAGVPTRIGRAINVPLIKSVINSQIGKEASVAKSPVPQITIDANVLGYVTVTIIYWLAVSGAQASLSFDVNN